MYPSYDEIDIHQGPVTAALKVMADSRRTMIEADMSVRALWKKFSHPKVTMRDIAFIPPNVSSSTSSLWSRSAEDIAVGGADGIDKTAAFDYFNNAMPALRSDDDLTNDATAKDRRLFMEIISEAEDYKAVIANYRHAVQTANIALKELGDWTQLDADRYLGLYVTAQTSRRTITGWVINTTAQTITVEVDRTATLNGAWASGWGIAASSAIYQSQRWVDQFHAWEKREDTKTEYRFDLNRTKVLVLMTRDIASKRRKLVWSWWSKYRRAVVAVDNSMDYKNLMEWLENGGKDALLRKNRINDFDWKAKLRNDPNQYYYGDDLKVWMFATHEVLRAHNLWEEAELLTREKLFARDTGGWLTPAEEETLSKRPDVPYEDWVGAVLYYFEKDGGIDYTRTIF